jgi:hypothetical protein
VGLGSGDQGAITVTADTFVLYTKAG